MEGDPAQFEATGSRLGFRIEQENPEKLVMVWRGARFPAFLCLGISLALLFLSIPIVEALRRRGFQSPAGSLWYFPLMNLILLLISVFLFSLRRRIVVDGRVRRLVLHKASIFRSARLSASYDEVAALRLGADQVYSGFAVAGSSAAQTYPIPSLRLVLKDGQTVLLDRGGMKRLEQMANHLCRRMATSLEKIAD